MKIVINNFMIIIELNILYINHLIIFLIDVSLIENLNLNMYRIISFPVRIYKNNFIFIQSSQEYVVIEKKDKFNTFKTIKVNMIYNSNATLSKTNQPHFEF